MAATRRQRPLLWCALACALLALARGEPLSEAQCQTARLNEPEKSFLQRSYCSVCQQVVRNRYRYPTALANPELLLESVPEQFRTEAVYEACKLLECADFRLGACKVLRDQTTGDVAQDSVNLSPCPAEMICRVCLPGRFKDSRVGCFDNFADIGL